MKTSSKTAKRRVKAASPLALGWVATDIYRLLYVFIFNVYFVSLSNVGMRLNELYDIQHQSSYSSVGVNGICWILGPISPSIFH